MDAMAFYQSSGWMFGMGDVQGSPDKNMTEKEWNAYLKKIDAVQESIREEIRIEGENNLLQADAARERRREYWKEQWIQMAELAKAHRRELMEPDESGHELLVRQAEPDGEWVPYSQYMRGNTIVYNGVTFLCDSKRHTISLGDVSNPKNVINIPLADGGTLLVNRNEVGSLAKAIGMFSAEDVGRILRALEEDKQIQKNQLTIEEEENQTMERMVSGQRKDGIGEA